MYGVRSLALPNHKILFQLGMVAFQIAPPEHFHSASGLSKKDVACLVNVLVY